MTTAQLIKTFDERVDTKLERFENRLRSQFLTCARPFEKT